MNRRPSAEWEPGELITNSEGTVVYRLHSRRTPDGWPTDRPFFPGWWFAVTGNGPNPRRSVYGISDEIADERCLAVRDLIPTTPKEPDL